MLQATDDWAFNIDQGNVNAVVFLDLKKAFDTVDHNILISKLSAYGIRGTSIEWFKSYLSERNQKCFLNGSLSSNRVLSCGIPQGTILGPFLFLLYINDLPNCLMHSEPRMYADDTHLTLAVNSIEHNLNEDLASVSEWVTANKVTLNKSKTELMTIGSRQRLKIFPHSLKIDGAPISQVPSTKSLGVYIDENLTWNVHTENLSKKVASCIGALKRIRPFVPHKTLLFTYNSLVKPHFHYCNVVWGSCNKTLANKLQKLQNRAARVLTSSAFDTSTEYVFQVLSWRRLESERQIQKACMLYKSLNGLAPGHLRSRFVEHSAITDYSLRNAEDKLAVPLHRTNFLKNSFKYSSNMLSNSN